jgi:hypothetical protein
LASYEPQSSLSEREPSVGGTEATTAVEGTSGGSRSESELKISRGTYWGVLFIALCCLIVGLLLWSSKAQAQNPIQPQPHPSCHCKKAKWNHGAYTYRVVWKASDGTRIYAKCRVNPRNGKTTCWVVRIG